MINGGQVGVDIENGPLFEDELTNALMLKQANIANELATTRSLRTR
jgi:hypothetical protein